MEINVTNFVQEWDGCFMDFSSSVAEIGWNAGKSTWNAAMETAEDITLVSTEQVAEVKDHFREFGAWEDSEINGWSFQEINALAIQEVSSMMRERKGLTLEEVEEKMKKGSIRCRLHQSGTQWFWYVGI